MTDTDNSAEVISNMIYLIRGQKVLLDADLAMLYGVETKYLTRQVRRNLERFPSDFMFRLTKDEFLRCQNVTSKGGRRYLPYVFTEQGVAMLSGVLNSKRAIGVNISIMRAFVRLREILSTQKDLVKKLVLLEKKLIRHDSEIQIIFKTLSQLLVEPQKPKKKIGFHK